MYTNFLTNKEIFLLTVPEDSFFEYLRNGLNLPKNATHEDLKKTLEAKEHEICKIPLLDGGALLFTFAEMFEIWRLKQINATQWNQEKKL